MLNAVQEPSRAVLSDRAKINTWKLGIASFAKNASHWRKKWVPYKWLVHLAQEIREAILWQEDARVIVNAPPRHGKSEFVSHWVPTWFLDLFPENEIILTAYGDSLASEWGQRVRDEFLMNEKLWTTLRADSQAVSRWQTTEDGGMRTAGVGGPITGKGGNLLIIDDPHKNWEDALSQTARERLIDWFQSTFYTRLEPYAPIIVIQTRWHEEDLTGYLINEHEDDWKVLRYPAIAEEDDILGREVGEPLCPERFSLERLQQIKRVLGSYIWDGLYQQRPAPITGGMIKNNWYNYYDFLPVDLDETIQTWDLVFKGEGTSFCAGHVWARKGANFYLVERLKEKLDFTEQLRAISRMSARYPDATVKLIEDAADAQAVNNTLHGSIPGLILVPTGRGSKEARLADVVGVIESGNVFLPRKADWLDEFKKETTTFPRAKNDDDIDAMVLALKRFKSSSQLFNLSFLNSSGVQQNPWRF